MCDHAESQGKAPAELAGVKVEGEIMWLTVTQNARARQQKLDSPKPQATT